MTLFKLQIILEDDNEWWTCRDSD